MEKIWMLFAVGIALIQPVATRAPCVLPSSKDRNVNLSNCSLNDALLSQNLRYISQNTVFIDLSNNNITTCDRRSFDHLKYLRGINIDNNPLKINNCRELVNTNEVGQFLPGGVESTETLRTATAVGTIAPARAPANSSPATPTPEGSSSKATAARSMPILKVFLIAALLKLLWPLIS